MKVVFWLLDINTQFDDNKIELWLWGIDDSGNRVLVVERNFVAYFYAVVKEGAVASKVEEAIKAGYGSSFVKMEIVQKKFFGKPVQAIKVWCKAATETGKLAKQLRSLEGVEDCLEADIRAAMRYLIDNNIVPCSWHQVEVSQEENAGDIRAAKVYVTKTPPTLLEKTNAPPLRVLAFNMICYNREGSPLPDRNPVTIISTSASDDKEHQFLADENKADKQVIEDFFRYVCDYDPDIIASFGANNVDWRYLRGRAHKYKLKLDFDRAKQEPHTSVYGHISTTGVVNLDLADFMDVFPEVKVKTLWNLSDHLDIKSQLLKPIEDVFFADFWDDKQKRKDLLQFGLDSARRVQQTTGLLLGFAIQLSNLTSLPLDHVMTAAVGFRVEWFLIKQVQKIGELIPNRVEQPYTPYVGGLVLSPESGLHDNIAVLDFKSMYPNIMITYNLSPDTFIPPNQQQPPSGVYTAPEVGHQFRKSPPGFYKEALMFLISIRGQIRKKMKKSDQKSVGYSVLDARQKAVKVITNAAYGYAGWIGARWYIKPVAEAASAWGRHIILTSSKIAEKDGIKVVYGDTDSIFIDYEKDRTKRLQDQIKDKFKLETEVDQIYKRIFFTEAKKRYAGLRQDGSLDVVGLEVIRGDWAEVAKNVQEHVLEIILNEPTPKNAVEYVRSIIEDLKCRKVPLHNLIIWKTLTKPPEKYAVRAPHVEAAKMLKEKGWRLTSGDKVGYVVLTGKGRLYARVKPYVFANINEVDVDYYVTNQVLPAATRILAFFNVTTEELLKEKAEQKEEKKSLMDFV